MLITHQEGLKADLYGCLPSFSDVFKWHEDTGKLWACHDRPDQPCMGLITRLKEKGIEYDINSPLITEKSTLEDIYDNVE